MPTLPLTPEEEKRALHEIGVPSLDDLFSAIPPKVRERAHFDFGPDARALTEHELRRYFSDRAAKNGHEYTHFLGGGIYDNIYPAALAALASRGEFLTSYTPYQPEISQGTLQAIFEFQTMIKRITGMEVANASLYDGATATAEAVLMSQRLCDKPQAEVLVAGSLPPDYRKVIQTYLKCHARQPIEVKWSEDGTLDTAHLKELLEKHQPSALVVGYPNYFGIIEPLDQLRSLLPPSCLLAVSVPDLSALSIYETPGHFGADIVCGEAQGLGTPMLFGGPHVGIFATRKKFLRQMPGRLAGETVDSRGNRAYALTLSTREQHIRREKATSNICTNQGLIALRTTMYLSFLGKRGFEQLGTRNLSLFSYLKEELEGHGIPLKFKRAEHYREGIFEIPNLERRFDTALKKKIVPGIRLKGKFQGPRDPFEGSLLVAVHPKLTRADADALVEVLSHD